MTYRVTLNGKPKEEAVAAFTEESAALVKRRDMREEGRSNMMGLLNALPEGNVSGFIQDFNNGTVVINITVKYDATADALASPAPKDEADPKKGMPGAADKGRPDVSPSAMNTRS